ncbi:HSP20-like chaperone [Choanephora cucurbitarum]|nr:HSP20-like chaperone [Choanephora cucurbitarum]KAI8355643.1 HSP20-like chaperone [Choanephora cucurbitarum]
MALTQRLFNDALRDMQRAMAVFDQPLFNSVFNDASQSGFGRHPATDIVEKDECYELHAEVPGYDKKDIKIEIPDRRTLVLSGSMKKEHHQEPKKAEDKPTSDNQEEQAVQKKDTNNQVAQYSSPQWWVNERVSGSFSRTFSFPTPIHADQIKASYENGVLKVIIPKTTENQSKFINID